MFAEIANAPPVCTGISRLACLHDLFKIGIGPSSSHTIGPMKAAGLFRQSLEGQAVPAAAVTVRLYGSLAWTGSGHGTDKAVLLGLAGEAPDNIDPDAAEALVARIQTDGALPWVGGTRLPFSTDRDLVFDRTLPAGRHPNTMRFDAFDAAGATLLTEWWSSVGGGFVVKDGAAGAQGAERMVPYPYESAEQLLAWGRTAGRSIAEIAFANEISQRTPDEVYRHITRVEEAMLACIARGLDREGELPGGLNTRRRAKALYQALLAEDRTGLPGQTRVFEYVSAFAMAVNEENAAGGRVVTAPTNGAAGVIPAVLRYYLEYCQADPYGVHVFFLTAAAVGALIKHNGSISGAEVGCQGEVGSASAMAAAGLAAALGATNEQVENAAEIAMEHHLGMTCDPIGGLVQIPCIERNAFGAIKAINAASLAIRGDGVHTVSLDQVVRTMLETGRDMNTKYKETALGGLAVNVPEC